MIACDASAQEFYVLAVYLRSSSSCFQSRFFGSFGNRSPERDAVELRDLVRGRAVGCRAVESATLMWKQSRWPLHVDSALHSFSIPLPLRNISRVGPLHT